MPVSFGSLRMPPVLMLRLYRGQNSWSRGDRLTGSVNIGCRSSARSLVFATIGGVLLTFLIGCSNSPSGDSTATIEAVHAAFATLDTASLATRQAHVPQPATPTANAATSAMPGTALPAATDVLPRMDTETPSAPPRSATATSRDVAATPQAGGSVPNPSRRPYVDPQGRFSFLVPAGWQIRLSDQPGVAVQVIAETMFGNVNVAIESAPVTTLDQYVIGAIAAIAAQDPYYRLAPPGVQPAALGNHPGIRYDLQVESKAGPLHVTQFIALVGDTAFIVTLTSAENDHDLFARESQVVVATFTVPADAAGTGPAPPAVTPSATP